MHLTDNGNVFGPRNGILGEPALVGCQIKFRGKICFVDARRKWDHQDGVRWFVPIPSIERDDNNRAPSFLWRIGTQLDEPNLTTTRRILDFGHLCAPKLYPKAAGNGQFVCPHFVCRLQMAQPS
jgi:hypothetical protein